MTTQDKLEKVRHNLHVAILNAHKCDGLSWARLHKILDDEAHDVWNSHQAMLVLFPENKRHSEQ